MHNPIQLIEIRPREGFTRCSPLRRGVLLTALMLASFALSPMAQAQSENTATGFEALFSNTTGDFNTATGYQALWLNTTGNRHTAVGWLALENCIAPPDFAGNTAVGTQALNSDTTGNF